MAEEKKETFSLDFDFAPEWARQSPEEARKRFVNKAHAEAEDERATRGARGRDRNWGGKGEAGERREKMARSERRSERREAPPGGFERTERRHRDERNQGASFRRQEQGEERRQFVQRDEERAPRGRDGAAYNQRAPMPPPPELPFELRLLPEQKALGTVIRRIQTTHRAYPLRDIAHLFLNNPAETLMRIELNKDQPAEARVYQCKVCNLPALSQEEIAAHIIAAHMDHFFDVSDVEGEAPTGNFSCVARCGFSGELLGPPNHHGFTAKVQEMLRTRYAHKSPEEYNARIEMVRDPELIEQWREQAKRRRIYRLKSDKPKLDDQANKAAEEAAAAAAAEGAETAESIAAAEAMESAAATPPLERDAAERLLMREIVPQQISATRSLVATVEVTRRSPSSLIAHTLSDALFRENRFPALLFFALRGAFRHRKLHLFKVNDPRGPDFVMFAKPEALDVSHATEELRTICGYINDHSPTTRQELLKDLAKDDMEQQQGITAALNLLVERGHVIEYFNGALCAPMENPKFQFPHQRGRGERPAHGERREDNTELAAQLSDPVENQPAPTAVPEATTPPAPPTGPETTAAANAATTTAEEVAKTTEETEVSTEAADTTEVAEAAETTDQ